ncbi:MAG: betaine-aldehyde dehydrogenase [Deltaproteobacteria bacterium]|jgi:acyl-CoA reductase-like NAD-dependent aldehyde dehydrogenase|nr:betaine-aldehyde dehydrogenase [Deltaproteobacteria bacterium]
MPPHTVEVEGVELSTDHWIGGERVASAERFAVRSPIDGTHLAEVSAGGAGEVDAAVAAARSAFPAWAGLGPEGRAPILRRFAEAIRDRADEIAPVETADVGSLLVGNRMAVVPRAAHNIAFFAERALELGEVIDSEQALNEVRYDPSGVAALITPWNAPFMLTTWKLGPALAAGSSVVLKPPEWAPLSCSLLADIAAGAGLPPGVLNLVQGIGEDAGAALARHPDVARISFTGSTDTARSVGRSAALNLCPVSFELGGKSPLLVFADADLDAAAQTVAAQYMNAGQVCLAGTRILVEAEIAEALRQKLAAAVAALRVGDPREPGTRMGPLIHPEHFARVSGFVERARAAGARAAWGGGRHEAGELYFEPTLLDGVERDSELFRKEVFGPVLSWHTFSDEDEAVELANDQEYGLAATLFSKSEERARRVADRVVAGTVWVNCYFIRELAAPFGGSRNSGIGREGGSWSFDFFCDLKNVAVRKGSFD